MMLEGKTAIVTGAGSGMGRAISTLFADEGANVLLAEISPESGNRIAQSIADKGHQALFVKTDVSKEEDVREVVRVAVERFGKLDIVINNAGLGAKYPSWEDVIRVNVQGVYYGCKLGAQAMLESGGGSIVSTSTAWAVYAKDDEACLRLQDVMKGEFTDLAEPLVGLVSGPGEAYLVSKRMVNYITRLFAVQTAPHNTRVNAIAPGYVMTEGMGRPLTESEEAYKHHTASMPMNRLAEPDEIARVVRFLVSEDASFITGAILAVDAGWSASLRLSK